MLFRLPKRGRPLGIYYRVCDLGLDLPAQFIYDLRGIDENLYPIFHPYNLLWDNLVNEYVGSLDDPRFSIVENSFKVGQLVMGQILTDGSGIPLPDGHWHIWRWCEPACAWAHIINIDNSEDNMYLNLLVKRLWLQAQYNDRYGHRGYQELMENLDIKRRAKVQEEKKELMNEIYKVNSSMVNRVIDNFHRGQVKPTNPKKESIVSYPGQKNRSRIIRPLEDREGMILPDKF